MGAFFFFYKFSSLDTFFVRKTFFYARFKLPLANLVDASFPSLRRFS